MSPFRSPRRLRRAVVPGIAALAVLVASAPVGATTRSPEPGREPLVRLTADDPVVRSAEVALARGEQRLRTTSYSMVGATWRGPAPQVSIRTSPGGRWRDLPALADLPDPDTGEGRDGLRATELVWTGPQRGIEVRVRGGHAADVELVLIDPGERAGDSQATATTLRRPAARKRPDTAPRPEMRRRWSWGADPSWRNGRPRYNDKLKQVHVHHTATGNGYRRRDVPGIIRGMYRYHTKTMGWFDIGYNFLVDKFGRTWVGRSGGPARLVRGAHTLGFNHTSVGVAVIGNHDRRRPGLDVLRALKRLAAWKLDKYDRRARGRVRVRSEGSDKYADGERVRLPIIDGHRDTNDTACPGDRLYDRLPQLRRMTQRRIHRFS